MCIKPMELPGNSYAYDSHVYWFPIMSTGFSLMSTGFHFQTSVIPSVEDVDADVLSTMNSLQCFKDKEKLTSELLSSK